jgi:hypothetical protein
MGGICFCIKEAVHRRTAAGHCGNNYFWMDILRVDQKNDQARVAVTQHIPAVSQQVERTIVVRDDGLR